jgi:two-component system osmolarity sensor histidine kinase EnvZ
VIAIGAGEGRPAMDLVVARRRLSASNPHQLLVIMASTGFLMTGLAYLFLRNQLRPIRRLAVAAEDFGKGRTVPYRPAGATEVRSAGRAFLEMRGRIESQIEQRTMMLSGVSHDLRTPLTRMRLGLSMLDQTPEVKDIERDVDRDGGPSRHLPRLRSGRGAGRSGGGRPRAPRANGGGRRKARRRRDRL